MTKTIYPYYVNSPETTLVDAISAYDVSFNVADGTKLPAAPNIANFGTGEDSETFRYTSLVGNLVSGVTRGFDVSGNYGVAKPWGAGEVVARRWTAYDAEAISENAAGDVVGPASATDGNLAVFDGTDGRKIKDGGAIPSGGGGGRNAIINGDCRVNQRATAYTLIKDAYTWDTSDLYGPDRHEGMATGTAVSAGTFGQSTSSLAGTSGYGFHFSGVTLTGTGVIYQRGRIEAKDAARFKNQTASFSCKVYQDTGGAVNFTVYIRKANSADNFAAVTAIGNSGAISIPDSTDTALKYEAISMGDCSAGIEYEIKGEVGAITTKNVYISEIQLEIGSVATAFENRAYHTELSLCMRYAFLYGRTGAAVILTPFGCRGGGFAAAMAMQFPTPMRATPAMVTSNPSNVQAAPSGNEFYLFNESSQTYETGTGTITWSGVLGTTSQCLFQIAFESSLTGTSGNVEFLSLGSTAWILFTSEL